MANPANTLQATITATDANGNVPVNRSIGSPTYNISSAVVGDLTVNQQLAAGDTALGLPVGQVQNIYIKNNAAPGGNTITVKLNLNGTGLVVVAILQPSGVLAIWNIVGVAASAYTGITLNASGANTPVEYFIGG